MPSTCFPHSNITSCLLGLISLVLCWGASPSPAVAKPSDPPPGFTALFNGKDLSGWCGRGHVDPREFRELPVGEQAKRQKLADEDLAKHWRVEDRVLVNDGAGVFCTTVKEYRDFELLVDWKMVKPFTDSGIYLRGCPQIQIWDPESPTQQQHGAHLGSGGLWNNNPGSPGKDPLVKADRPVGEWNTFRVRIVGDRVTVHLNDQLVVDNAVMHNFWDRQIPLYQRGPIQLQTHGGEMRFRNLFIREISNQQKEPEKLSVTIPGSDVTFEMLPVPAGTFRLGSPLEEPGRRADEGPQTTISVDAFWMGKHEVTWGEYKQFMKLTSVFEKFEDRDIRKVSAENQVDAVTAPSKLYDPSFTFATGDDPRQPAVSMSQYAAKQYTKWLSLLTGEFYRLPTEAEWEYACRAGTTTAYSFGDNPEELTEYAWYYENAEDDYATAPVGSYRPNPWGFHDMHGNIWEWVLDGYEPDGYQKLADKQNREPLAVNWSTKRFPRVLRGGSWSTEDPARCRSAARLASDDDAWRSYDPNTPQSPWWLASDQGQTVGFRIVRPVNPPPKEEWTKFWNADVEQIQADVDRRIDQEGRGERGIVDPGLIEAIKEFQPSE